MSTKKIKHDLRLETLASDGAGRVPYLDQDGNMVNSIATQADLDALPATVISIGTAIQGSEKDQPNGVAGLDGSGKIDSNQLPAIAITDVFSVGFLNQRDYLTVGTGEGEVQEGDVVVVADASGHFPYYILPFNNVTGDVTLKDKGAARNGESFSVVIEDPAANDTDKVKVVFSGSATAIVLTVTPNDGTNNSLTPVDMSSAQLIEFLNTGAVSGVNLDEAGSIVTLRDEFLSGAAAGGDATVLANGGEGDFGSQISANGIDGDVESGAASYIYKDGAGYLLLKASDSVDSVAGKTGAVSLSTYDSTHEQGTPSDWSTGNQDIVANHLDEVGSRLTSLEGISSDLGDGTLTLVTDNVFVDIPGLSFADGPTAARVMINFDVNSGSEAFSVFVCNSNIGSGSGFVSAAESLGVNSSLSVQITPAGQVQVAAANVAGEDIDGGTPDTQIAYQFSVQKTGGASIS